MAVIADVDADARVSSVEGRITEIAGPEIKFFPEARIDVRNMMLSILAEVRSIGVDDRGRVVIDAGHFFFIDRHDDYHVVLLRRFLHELCSWAIGNFLNR